MAMRSKRTMPSDARWALIEPLRAGRKGDRGRSGEDNRRFMEGVLWIVRTGAPWRDLPPSFSKWNTVFRRFRRWTGKGVFQRMFEELSSELDFGEVRIDGTNVRVRQHATGKGGAEKPGRSRGGLTTKVVALVDALGRLARFELLAGHRHESPAAEGLLTGLTFGALLANRGFDSDRLIATRYDQIELSCSTMILVVASVLALA